MLPRVAVVCTSSGSRSREEQQLAQYVALCVAASGRSAKTHLVALKADGRGDEHKSDAVAIRCDGAVLDSQELPAGVYEEGGDWKTLEDCDLWLLVLEADVTLQTAEFLHKKLKKQDTKTKHVVVSLQTTMRRLAQLNAAYVTEWKG
jgi:hypothetical protein